MTEEVYELKKKSISVLEQLEMAKIELKRVGGLAHDTRHFAPPDVYAKLQNRVAQLKVQHQKLLLDISYLTEKDESGGKNVGTGPIIQSPE